MTVPYELNANMFQRIIVGMTEHRQDLLQPLELKDITSDELTRLREVCDQELERRKSE